MYLTNLRADLVALMVISGFDLFGGGWVKSIQRGEGVFPVNSGIEQNITINQIDPQKTIVRVHFWSGYVYPYSTVVMGHITSPTNLHVSRYSQSLAATSFLWEVIEFDDSVHVQTGEVLNITSNTQVNINPVNPERSLIFFSWKTSLTESNVQGGLVARAIRFIDNSTIEILALGDRTVRWYVVEFPS